MSTAVEKNAHLVRGRMWAADCGVEFQALGHEPQLGGWEYLTEPAACHVCTGPIPVGRLVIRDAAKRMHVRCAPRSDRGCMPDTHAAKWHRDTIRATKVKGDASTATPSATAAAKSLAKVDPVKAPRFQVVAAASAHPLASAARSWAMAAEVARSSAPAVGPKSSTTRGDRKAAARAEKVAERVAEHGGAWPEAPAVEPAEVTYRTVEPLADDPVGERLERIARVVDHFPAVDVRPVAELPECVEEWLGRLVFGPKADYARAYVAHLLSGAPAPEDPGAEWAEKARKRAVRVVAQVTR